MFSYFFVFDAAMLELIIIIGRTMYFYNIVYLYITETVSTYVFILAF